MWCLRISTCFRITSSPHTMLTFHNRTKSSHWLHEVLYMTILLSTICPSTHSCPTHCTTTLPRKVVLSIKHMAVSDRPRKSKSTSTHTTSHRSTTTLVTCTSTHDKTTTIHATHVHQQHSMDGNACLHG